ncbi:tetratricopeptide repeat protein [Saccharothrix deserti]|uniref:tetratricopeptide repeat protein n=1 Tax=Saccharothrix deserti TaxID=2593674 RepID=UPI00131A8FDA
MLAAGDDLGHARLSTTRADVVVRTGRPTDAVPLLTNALPVATRSGSPLHIADVQAALGRCAQATGDPDRAVEWFTAAQTNYLAAHYSDRADAMSVAIAYCATTADPRPGSRDRHRRATGMPTSAHPAQQREEGAVRHRPAASPVAEPRPGRPASRPGSGSDTARPEIPDIRNHRAPAGIRAAP